MDVDPVEWNRVTDLVKRIDHHIFGNGKPALEDRLRLYIDERDKHKERNAQQELTDFKGEMNSKHTQNVDHMNRLETKMDTVTRLVYIGLGIVIALESVGLFKMK